MLSVNRKRVELSSLVGLDGKLSFETVPLAFYMSYELRLTAVGYGSVFSSWSASAVAGGCGTCFRAVHFGDGIAPDTPRALAAS